MKVIEFGAGTAHADLYAAWNDWFGSLTNGVMQEHVEFRQGGDVLARTSGSIDGRKAVLKTNGFKVFVTNPNRYRHLQGIGIDLIYWEGEYLHVDGLVINQSGVYSDVYGVNVGYIDTVTTPTPFLAVSNCVIYDTNSSGIDIVKTMYARGMLGGTFTQALVLRVYNNMVYNAAQNLIMGDVYCNDAIIEHNTIYKCTYPLRVKSSAVVNNNLFYSLNNTALSIDVAYRYAPQNGYNATNMTTWTIANGAAIPEMQYTDIAALIYELDGVDIDSPLFMVPKPGTVLQNYAQERLITENHSGYLNGQPFMGDATSNNWVMGVNGLVSSTVPVITNPAAVYSTGQIHLTWALPADVSNVTKFEIYRCRRPEYTEFNGYNSTAIKVGDVATTETEFTDDGAVYPIEPDVEYYYRVKSV